MREAWTRRFRGTERFRPVQKLGEGGMGVVYEADDLERGERVAIKLLTRADPEAIRRFKHEYRALMDIEHPNLVRLGELHEDDGMWFFSMELVPGKDLCQYVREESEAPQAVLGRGLTSAPANDGNTRLGFSEERLRASFAQLASAIEALHDAGKIHCDIKPSNVRVTHEGRVVLLDFGLVFERGGESLRDASHIVGTPLYMAPEQAQEAGVCFASDFYAYGVVLYEALTGSLPFTGEGLTALLEKVHKDPPRPSRRIAGLPRDLDDLCVALLSRDPRARPNASDIRRVLGGAPLPVSSLPPRLSLSPASANAPFVGRERELQRLHRAHERVLSGSTVTVSVEGTSGLGKSTLMARFIEQVRKRHRQALVLKGRCYERETARFKALDGVVDELASALLRMPLEARRELVPRDAALLRLLFPVLERVDVIGHAPRSPTRSRDSVEERRLMFAALRELFARIAARRPLVLAIDDMQWADGDSLELLRALVDESHEPAPRMLVLVTSREGWNVREAEGDDPWPGPFEVVELVRLSDQDTEALAREHLERLGNTTVEPRSLVREAEGHPLFVAELAWLAHHAPRGAHVQLTLDEAIWTRASSLSDEAMSVLVVLSVAAIPLKPRILAAALGKSPTEIDRLLVGLRLAALVKTVSNREANMLEPYHDRVREAVLTHLDREARREVHALLAPLLEAEEGMDPELVAQHYFDAGDKQKASALFARAAQHAEDGLAFERAALLYRALLELGRHDPGERSELYKRLAQALVRAGRAKAAADAYTAALTGAREHERVALENAAATCLLRSGHVAEGLAALENVLRSVDLSMPRTRSRALMSFAWERLRLLLRGYHANYRAESDVPVNDLRRADALFAVAQGFSLVDGVRCSPIAAQALRAALHTGERSRIVKALAGEAAALSLGGRITQRGALRAFRALKTAVEGVDSPLLRGYVLGAEITYANSHGLFQEAYDKANEALALYDEPGLEAQWERAYVRTFRIFSQFYLGRMREMYEEGEVALRDAQMRRDRWFESILRIGPCSLGVIGDDLTHARELNEQGYAPWRDRAPGFLFWCWFVKTVVFDLLEGRWDLALSHYAEHHKALLESGSWHVPMLRAHLCGYRAVALLHKFHAQSDASALKEAEFWLRKMKPENPLMYGWASLVRAQLAEARRAPDALALAQHAAQEFERCGAERFFLMAESYRARLEGKSAEIALTDRLARYFARERLTRWDPLVIPFVPSLYVR